MVITKNGFSFCHIPLEFWNSNDHCLACHELPHEQTTVEFSGSWSLSESASDGIIFRTYDKFYMSAQIYVENSSSKWVYIPYIYFKFTQTGSGFTRTGDFKLPVTHYEGEIFEPDKSYYQLLLLFNSKNKNHFDLSQLTLTSPDRLDAKGTYYINWQTYQFQNNGKQLLKDVITPDYNSDFIMTTIDAVLQGLRTLGIEEWLPGDNNKVNIYVLDRTLPRSEWEWLPLRHNAYFYLDNRHANIHYCKYNEDVFYQSDEYTLRFEYFVKHEYEVPSGDFYTRIEGFTVQN